jgi:hypothetical protein
LLTIDNRDKLHIIAASASYRPQHLGQPVERHDYFRPVHFADLAN